MAQDTAPAVFHTDRCALPQKPGGEHRPTEANHGTWARSNPVRPLRAVLDDRSRCQPHGVRGGIPQEAKAWGNAQDKLT